MDELEDEAAREDEKQEKKEGTATPAAAPAPSSGSVNGADADSILTDPGAGPGLPVSPEGGRGVAEKSSRPADPMVYGKGADTEEAAMQESRVDLAGYRAADPAPIGTNPGAEPDVVQTVNVPRKSGTDVDENVATDGGRTPLQPRPFDPAADVGAKGPGLAEGMTAEGGDFVDWVGIVRAQAAPSPGPWGGLMPEKLMMAGEGPDSLLIETEGQRRRD